MSGKDGNYKYTMASPVAGSGGTHPETVVINNGGSGGESNSWTSSFKNLPWAKIGIGAVVAFFVWDVIQSIINCGGLGMLGALIKAGLSMLIWVLSHPWLVGIVGGLYLFQPTLCAALGVFTRKANAEDTSTDDARAKTAKVVFDKGVAVIKTLTPEQLQDANLIITHGGTMIVGLTQKGKPVSADPAFEDGRVTAAREPEDNDVARVDDTGIITHCSDPDYVGLRVGPSLRAAWLAVKAARLAQIKAASY